MILNQQKPLITKEKINLDTIIVYAGTFDPIHYGHLRIAEAVKANAGYDKVMFIPTFSAPHKDIVSANPYDRLKMLELAISNYPDFLVNRIEYDMKLEKSYSLKTVEALLDIYPSSTRKVNFLIGIDAFELIDSWHNPSVFAEKVNFIIVNRPGSTPFEKVKAKINLKNYTYQLIEAPLINISSSGIREKIKENSSIQGLTPEAVRLYILNKRLYQ